MKAYSAQRTIDGLGEVDVLEIKLEPLQSMRFHSMSKDAQRRWLQDAGLKAETYYCTNDSDGNVYYFEAA